MDSSFMCSLHPENRRDIRNKEASPKMFQNYTVTPNPKVTIKTKYCNKDKILLSRQNKTEKW